VILSGVAKPWAIALFNAAVNQGIVEQVQEDLASVTAVMKANPRFRTFLSSPEVLTEDKKQMLMDVFGERTAGLVMRLLGLLIEKGRFAHLEQISDAYEYLYEQRAGIVEATVITAVPLDEELERKTIGKLERDTGKTIRLTKKVDRKIIGGMIVMIEDTVIDGSIRHQLERVRSSLREVNVH
jgi:F-type H+-transporting ATPase subunit delta